MNEGRKKETKKEVKECGGGGGGAVESFEKLPPAALHDPDFVTRC